MTPLDPAQEKAEKIAYGSLEKTFIEITSMTDQQIARKALSAMEGE